MARRGGGQLSWRVVIAATLIWAGAGWLAGSPAVWGAPLHQAATLQIGALAKVGNSGGEAVNVRERPGLSANVLGSLAEGTLVLIVGGPETADGYRWWQINSPSLNTGWMGENWLVPVVNPQPGGTPAAGAPAAATAAPSIGSLVATPVVTVLPVGVGPSVPTPTPVAALAGSTPAPATTPSAAATPAAAANPGGAFQINGRAIVAVGEGEALNIRQTASTSAALSGIAPNGSILTIVDGPVTAEGYRWWLVTWSGVTGFVVENYIVPAR